MSFWSSRKVRLCPAASAGALLVLLAASIGSTASSWDGQDESASSDKSNMRVGLRQSCSTTPKWLVPLSGEKRIVPPYYDDYIVGHGIRLDADYILAHRTSVEITEELIPWTTNKPFYIPPSVVVVNPGLEIGEHTLRDYESGAYSPMFKRDLAHEIGVFKIEPRRGKEQYERASRRFPLRDDERAKLPQQGTRYRKRNCYMLAWGLGDKEFGSPNANKTLGKAKVIFVECEDNHCLFNMTIAKGDELYPEGSICGSRSLAGAPVICSFRKEETVSYMVTHYADPFLDCTTQFWALALHPFIGRIARTIRGYKLPKQGLCPIC